MIRLNDDDTPSWRPSPRVYRSDGNGGLIATDGHTESDPGPAACAAHAALRGFVEHPDYPCVGAKASLAQSSYAMGFYPTLRDVSSAPQTVADLGWFGTHISEVGDSYVTFLAVFQGADLQGPEHFEEALWAYLQAMHHCDSLECEWDPRVSDDPRDPEFRFSIGGCAYFVIGLHPLARREARRFPFPTLVFNLHTQFQQLRDAGTFERIRSTIRDREQQLEGTPNPLLKDFGQTSEAAQYAGRPHPPGWLPPFCPVKRPTRKGPRE